MSEGAPSASRVLTRPAMLGLHLLAGVAVAVMVLAGLWQLGIYGDTHRDVSAAKSSAPAAPLGQLLGPDDALTPDAAFTRVAVQGTYADAAEQFLVRDREHAGQQGYWVVTPLLVADPSSAAAVPSALLVVRGWQASAALPPVPAGEVRVTGVLAPGEQQTTTVGPDRVVDSVRVPALVNALPFDLYSGYLVRSAEDPPPDDGLAAVAPPPPDVSWATGLRNLAYALQWWVFAGFAVFMWWRICRDEVARHRVTPRPRAPASIG